MASNFDGGQFVPVANARTPTGEGELENADGDIGRKYAERLFPNSANAIEYAKQSLGMPEGATFNIEPIEKFEVEFKGQPSFYADGLAIEAKHPAIKGCYRFLGTDPDGNRFCHNIKMGLVSRGTGLGTEIFSKQVEFLSSAGFSYIATFAAGDGQTLAVHPESENGFATWPKLGYDMRLDDPGIPSYDKRVFEEARRWFPGAETIQQLFDINGGEEWWCGIRKPDGTRTRANGRSLRNAKFDLKEGSPSMKRLKGYLQRTKHTTNAT